MRVSVSLDRYDLKILSIHITYGCEGIGGNI